MQRLWRVRDALRRGRHRDGGREVVWQGRLAVEMPFIERQLRSVEVRRVLDAACGTGMHAIALAERGYEVIGADVSMGMIERARDNAVQSGLAVGALSFRVAGFGQGGAPPLGPRLGDGFDAVLCLGNSLPHALTPERLAAALDDFAASLRPGGLLLIQNRNFDAVLMERDRWMEPEGHREGETEWLFLRFYDFEPGGLVTFNLIRLRRAGGEYWNQWVTSAQLWPQTRAELTGALADAGLGSITCFGDLRGAVGTTALQLFRSGLGSITCFGDLRGAAFDAKSSPNLVVTGRR